MTFHSDLSRLIRGQFDKHGISYDCLWPLDRLTARYIEMCTRRIQPGPRRVHFSDETYDSLGKLSRQGKDDTSAWDSWGGGFSTAPTPRRRRQCQWVSHQEHPPRGRL